MEEPPGQWRETVVGQADRLTLSVEARRAYDAVVRPEAIVPVPRYFLRRWLPLLGPSRAWLALAFRQVAFVRRARQPEVPVRVTLRRLARWCGLTHVRVRQLLLDPQLLAWFVRPDPDADPSSRSAPGAYRVRAEVPLTPDDQARLARYLEKHRPPDDQGWEEVLESALEAQLDDLPPGTPLPDRPLTVQELVQRLRDDPGPLPPGLDRACTELHSRWVQPERAHLVTHYFLRRWLPDLSPGLGWLIVALRDRVYAEQQALAGRVWLRGGWTALAAELGVSRKSLGRWAATPPARAFFEVDPDGADPADPRSRLVVVRLAEPIHPGDRTRYEALLAGQNLTTRPEAAGQNLTAAPPAQGQNLTDGPADGGQKLPEDGPPAAGEGQKLPAAPQNLPAAGQELTVPASEVNSGETEVTALSPFKDSPPQVSSREVQPAGQGVGEDPWPLDSLLRIGGIDPDLARDLTARGAAGWAYVSHLLYALSPAGEGIRHPARFAARRLAADPERGAGGPYDDLARLGPEELSRLIAAGARRGYLDDPRWTRAMGSDAARAGRAAELLGLPLEEPPGAAAATGPPAPAAPHLRAWRTARDQLQLELPRGVYDTWLRDVELVACQGDTFVLGAANAYARDWLEDRLRRRVEQALTGALARPATVRFVVVEEAVG